MTLARLVEELDRAESPMSVIELAMRLGTTVGEVSGMIAALRASGRLGPPAPGALPEACPQSGGCGLRCPGPEACALVIDPRLARWGASR